MPGRIIKNKKLINNFFIFIFPLTYNNKKETKKNKKNFWNHFFSYLFHWSLKLLYCLLKTYIFKFWRMLPDKTRKFFEGSLKKHLTNIHLQCSLLKYLLNFFQKTICEANIRKYYFNTHNTFKARGENFILKTKNFVLNQQNLLNTKSSLVCWIQSWKNFKGVWAKINSWDFLPVRNIHWNIYCQKLRNTETGSQNIALQL